MNYNGEDPEELGELGDVLPAELLKKLNVLLEQLHHAEHPHHGSNIINIYASGSRHVDTIINFKEREGRRHGTYTDDVVERAIIALNGKDKPLCEKQLFLAVIKVLASKCGWSSKWATSCDRLNQLTTAMEWEVKCDVNNLKAPSALKFASLEYAEWGNYKPKAGEREVFRKNKTLARIFEIELDKQLQMTQD